MPSFFPTDGTRDAAAALGPRNLGVTEPGDTGSSGPDRPGVTVDRQQEFVLCTLEERAIRFVRLWFTDVLGTLKSVSVAPAELESAFEEGIGIDGSAIEGFARVYESDMVAMPDPTTFQVFPFEGGPERPGGESARMFCDIL